MSRGYASFVYDEDRVLVTACQQMYAVQSDIGDYKLMSVGNVHCRAWVRASEAIVAIRGTSVAGPEGLSDVIDDIRLSRGGKELIITENSKKIIESLFTLGYEVTVAGHSLGGFVAFKLLEIFPNIKRAVSFNGAAPPIGGPFNGVLGKSRFYHIVGDIVSTHMNPSTCELVRIHLAGDVDWDRTVYFHSILRFTETALKWDRWTAQNEQDSLMQYFSFFASTVNVVLGVITKVVGLPQLIEIIKRNPIPGSTVSMESVFDQSLGDLGVKTVGSIISWILKPELDLIGVDSVKVGNTLFDLKKKRDFLQDLVNPINVVFEVGGKAFDIYHESLKNKRRRIK